MERVKKCCHRSGALHDTTSARCNWNHLRSNLDFFCSKWPKYLHLAFKYIHRTFTHICLFCTSFQDKTSESQVTTFCIMTETKCTIENSLFLWTTEWMQHCRFFLTIEYPFLCCCLPETTFFLQSYSFTELVSLSPGLITFPRWNCWQHNKILSYALHILKYWACGAKVVQSYTVE